MVMRDADEGGHVRTFWQLTVKEAAAVDLETIPEVCARDLSHLGKVEQGEFELWITLGRGLQEGAVGAADVDQVAVLAEVVGGEDFRRHRLLRGGHQGGVVGRVALVGVAPEVLELVLFFRTRQHADGVGQVGIEQAVVGDEAGDPRVAGQGRAVDAEGDVASACPLQNLQRNRGLEQALGAVRRPADARRDGRGGERLARQHLDQPELDGAVEDLAVGEAGEQVEELPRPAAAHWPKQRKIHGKFLEAGR